MKNIGMLLVAGVIALVLGFGTINSTKTAQAEVDGSVVIGCEFLFDDIDGDPDDATTGADQAEACDGIDETDVANLANALGDEDDVLEASDFEDLDLDANQIVDAGTSISDETYAFAFVDNDGQVSFDAETGLVVTINPDGTVGEALPAADANTETCDGPDDLDCGTSTLDNGDGVVVATITDGTADAGDDVDVDIFQSDDTAQISTETITVTGAPDEVSIEAVLGKDIIQTSGSSSDQDDCEDDSEVSDTDQLADLNRTFVKATVTDRDDVELTRAVVDFSVDDEDIASIDDDSNDPNAASPNADTGISVDAGDVAGVGAFAVVCGGTDTGVASVTALINDGDINEDDASVDINVVGEPANVAVTASPAIIDCNGTSTATVSATVTDADGNNVANGTNVNFSVVALGTANPINADTADGVATSTITPLSGATAGTTVIVTSGDAQASIRVDCNTAAAATATPGGPVASPTRPGGVIGGPDTGNGGYLGQDSAGFPAWTLVALALGSMALVAGGMVTRRAGK